MGSLYRTRTLFNFSYYKEFLKDPRFFPDTDMKIQNCDYYRFLQITILQKKLSLGLLGWVHCGFTAFRAGWGLHCSDKYMGIKHYTYPRPYDHFPYCARCPLAALSLGSSSVYEEQLLTMSFGEERAQLPSCNCQARHSFKSWEQFVRELMHFW